MIYILNFFEKYSANKLHYSFEIETKIVIGCCIIHHFLMNFDRDERLIVEVDNEVMNSEIDIGTITTVNLIEDGRKGKQIWDSIATHIWKIYLSTSFIFYFINLENKK